MTLEELALVSHYSQLESYGVHLPYREEAIRLLRHHTSKAEFQIAQSDRGGVVREVSIPYSLFSSLLSAPFLAPSRPSFTFIDLFAGIGGFRLALQQLGGLCLFSSEIDKDAQSVYWDNYGDVPFGDITTERVKSHIPTTFDILCAGFPCQPFSIAGKRQGFEEARGTLFFDIAQIIHRHRPKAIFLENVKGLQSHNKGKTLQTILKILRQDLGYYVPDPEVLNAIHFGVPQQRERIFIVGFDPLQVGNPDFRFPRGKDPVQTFGDVKEREEVSVKYYLSTTYLETLRRHKARHEARGNGFGYAIVQDDEVANTIVVGGMGRERNLVIDHRLTDFTPVTNIKGEVNREGIRRMTPREWARLQGFPDDFLLQVSDSAAYRLLGNSVAVPAIEAVAREILQWILHKGE